MGRGGQAGETARVDSVASTVGSTTTNCRYTYDECGNVTHIYIGGISVEFSDGEWKAGHDAFIGLDDGDTTAGHVTEVCIGPITVNSHHYSEKGSTRILCDDCGIDDGYKNGYDHFKCKNSEISFSFEVCPFLSVDTKGNVVVSASSYSHFVLGMGGSAGINLTDFVRSLFD